MTVLDAHCDSPSQMLRLRDFGKDNTRGQVDFPKLKRGGVDASFFALYIPARLNSDDAAAYMQRLLAETHRQLAANPDKCALAMSRAQVEANKAAGLFSVLLGLENGSPIGHDLSAIERLYLQGVRYITLTHSADNQICDSCSGSGTWGGLSPFGREVVREMNAVGMMIDLAHCSDSTVRDVLELTDSPVAYTHGCCRALASHRRNLSDELLRGIAAGGGVVGMSIYPCFLSDEFVKVLADSGLEDESWKEDEFIKDPGNAAKADAWADLQERLSALPRPGIECVADHIMHAVEVCGAEHVGIGTDYDGIEVTAAGLEKVSEFGKIWDVLRRRGVSDNDVNLIAGENFLGLLDRIAAKAV